MKIVFAAWGGGRRWFVVGMGSWMDAFNGGWGFGEQHQKWMDGLGGALSSSPSHLSDLYPAIDRRDDE